MKACAMPVSSCPAADAQNARDVAERVMIRVDAQLLRSEIRFRQVLWQRTAFIIASVVAGWGVLLALLPMS